MKLHKYKKRVKIFVCSLKQFIFTKTKVAMKKFLFIVTFMTLGVLANAQSGAKIQFKAPENTIDYGTVTKEGDNGIRIFEFTNTGDAPLIIKSANASCGCTVPTKPTEPIQPGKTGKIEVKYNMNPGPIRKTITVETNAVNVESGKVVLHIKGLVVQPEEINVMEKKKSILSN